MRVGALTVGIDEHLGVEQRAHGLLIELVLLQMGVNQSDVGVQPAGTHPDKGLAQALHHTSSEWRESTAVTAHHATHTRYLCHHVS